MVDWDRVEELREKGWGWDRIAEDAKVGFHPDTSVREPGHALRGLYHRQRSRRQRQEPMTPSKTKKVTEERERRWSLARWGFLLTPILGIWFVLAYLVPSPVGLVLPAFPWLALGLAVVAFLLLFGLWRVSGPRWTKVLRTTLITGVVIGLVLSSMIYLGAALVFGCPFLPSSSTLQSQPGGAGWTSASVSAWQDGGKPVFYFYGAIWCPYCSASSWALYKALSSFGSLTGTYLAYSSNAPSEPYPNTPELVLGAATLSSQWVSFQVSMYTGGQDGVFPTTANCYQQAYVTAYSDSSIPFVVINGQYVHGGSSLIDPAQLQPWAGTGAQTVLNQVNAESGQAWTIISGQAWWTMAFMAKSTGATPSNLASQPYYSGWTQADRTNVANDLALL